MATLNEKENATAAWLTFALFFSNINNPFKWNNLLNIVLSDCIYRNGFSAFVGLPETLSHLC
jgi:hypothetical protein